MAIIGILALGRPTFDVEFANTLLSQAIASLKGSVHSILGGDKLLFDEEATIAAIDQLKASKPDLILVLQVTFTDAEMIVRIADEFTQPLAIWAFSEPRLGRRLRLNAFCGLNLAAHALGLNDKPFAYAYGSPEQLNAEAVVDDFLQSKRQATPKFGEMKALSAEQKEAVQSSVDALRNSRIGRIGAHPAGFDTCRYDKQKLKDLAGIEVDELDLAQMFDLASQQSEDTIATSRKAVSSLDGLNELNQDELKKSLALHGSLQQMQRENNYDAFAIRCWPETFTEYGGAVCGPVGMMGEAKTPCACEADVYGALTNLMAQKITEQAPFLVDLVDLDEASGTGVVWHCGQAPVSMADEEVKQKAALHSNRKMPLLFEFPLKAGKVTLVRISQARGQTQMFITEGDMQKAPLAFSGTAGVMRFDAGVPKVMSDIMDCGIEHHTTLVYGAYGDKFEAAATMLDMPVIRC